MKKNCIGLFVGLITMGCISNELFSMDQPPPPPAAPPPPPVFAPPPMGYNANIGAINVANSEAGRGALLQQIQNPGLRLRRVARPDAPQAAEAPQQAVALRPVSVAEDAPNPQGLQVELGSILRPKEEHVPSQAVLDAIARDADRRQQREQDAAAADAAREARRTERRAQEIEQLNPGYTASLRQYEATIAENRARIQAWQAAGGVGVPPAPIYVERPVPAVLPPTNPIADRLAQKAEAQQYIMKEDSLRHGISVLRPTDKRRELGLPPVVIPDVPAPQVEPATPQAQPVAEGLTPRELARLRREQRAAAASAPATPQTPQPTGLSAVAAGGLNAAQLAGEPHRAQKAEVEEEEEEERENQ